MVIELSSVRAKVPPAVAVPSWTAPLLFRNTLPLPLALVLAFISLFNIPFGTAIGVYTMWVLLPADSQREYDSLVAARAA